jgi:transposase InsO family protein
LHREDFDVVISCNFLSVRPSSYYSWQAREHKPSSNDDENAAWVKKAFEALKGNAGARAIKAYLQNNHQIVMSRRKIAKLMKKQQLVCQRKKKFKRGSSAPANDPNIAPNRLQRQFNVSYINQVWVSDITYIKTAMGWMYLAVFIDLYSRKVVGWALDTRMKSDLIETALKRALLSRSPPKGLIVHSDQGSQYISKRYRNLLKAWHLKPSMSRRGNCWDNAVAESFFKTLKVEMVYRQARLTTMNEMRLLISEFMGHYNHVRPHSKNDYLSPEQFEQRRFEKAKELEKNHSPCTQMG